MRKQLILGTAALVAAALQFSAAAQTRPALSNAVRAYVSVDAPLVALTHARVIDGTGAAPRENQTLILNNGIITTIGSSASTDVPAGAQTIDLTGKSVIPGLVMVHEHLYYPNGPACTDSSVNLLAPVSLGRRDDDEDGRQREWVHGPAT
jgi:enamidase